ncbi:MAG: DUF4276 family protein [Cycloclasticus sp.]|jgi:hypothetical protein
MSNYVEVIAIVEGKTEQIFVEKVLAPYLALKNIFMTATQVSKPGQKGGDVKFSRTVKDILNHLKQRPDTYVCTFIDYYGIKEWPGVDTLATNSSPTEIAQCVNQASRKAVLEQNPNLQSDRRYIPYLAVHEFEALLFSDSDVLANKLGIGVAEIQAVLDECGEPEAINNGPQTAPSKRLDHWCGGKFKKTTVGISIAEEIGISTLRKKCRVFNVWLNQLEGLVE